MNPATLLLRLLAAAGGLALVYVAVRSAVRTLLLPRAASDWMAENVFRTIRRMPFLKFVAVVQLALLARRHLGVLTPAERRRMADLVRHPHTLTPAERRELGDLAMKLEPRAFAGAAADHLSPFPLPKRLKGRG